MTWIAGALHKYHNGVERWCHCYRWKLWDDIGNLHCKVMNFNIWLTLTVPVSPLEIKKYLYIYIIKKRVKILINCRGLNKIRTLGMTLNGRKLNRLGLIQMYVRDVIYVCGRNFSYYAGQKCQLLTAEVNLRRAVNMLKNFYWKMYLFGYDSPSWHICSMYCSELVHLFAYFPIWMEIWGPWSRD